MIQIKTTLIMFFSLLSLSALAKERRPLKASDVKIDYGSLAPCVEITVEKVDQFVSTIATLTLKQVLRKPIEKCLRPSDSESAVTALVVDSSKNELLFSPYLNGRFPKTVGGTNRQDLFLTLPDNLKLPILIIMRDEP